MSLTWAFIFESSDTATLEGMHGCRQPHFSRLYTLHRNKKAHPLTWLWAYRHLSMIASWLNSRLIKVINNNSMSRKHKYHIHRLMQQRRNPKCTGVTSLFTMTSSNGNIFRVTGPLCGEFTGHRWIPRKKASDAELWFVFLDLRLNKWLSKPWWGWWFETLSRPLWCHCYVSEHIGGRGIPQVINYGRCVSYILGNELKVMEFIIWFYNPKQIKYMNITDTIVNRCPLIAI